MKKINLCVLIWLISTLSFGQKADLDSIDVKKLEERSTIFRVGFSPFSSDLSTNFTSSASLSAVVDGGRTAHFGIKLGSNDNQWLTGFNVDQEISGKESVPMDLEGLCAGTKVAFSLQKTFWSSQISNRSRAKFEQAKIRMIKRNPYPDTRIITYQDVFKDSIEGPRFRLNFRSPVLVNLTASLNALNSTFSTDSVHFSEASGMYYAPEIKATLSIPFSKNLEYTSLFRLSYVYSERYVPSDARSFLVPFGSTNNYESKSVVFGAPVKRTDQIVKAEWRSIFNSKSPVGMAPSVSFGLKSKKIAFILPLYFISGTKLDNVPNGLQGGLRVGYQTKTGQPWDSFKTGLTTEFVICEAFSVF